MVQKLLIDEVFVWPRALARDSGFFSVKEKGLPKKIGRAAAPRDLTTEHFCFCLCLCVRDFPEFA